MLYQFELTWRNVDAGGFVSCNDLSSLFGATLSVINRNEATPSRPFTCDLVYSVYFGPGRGVYVDCLTTDVPRPETEIPPEGLQLVTVEESESFSMARVSRGFVKSGSNDKVEIRIADSMDRPLNGYHVGVEIYAGPSYDSNSGLSLKCDDSCIVSREGYIYISYNVASVSELSQQDVDYIRIYWDTYRNDRYDAGQDPYHTAQVEIVNVNYVALGDSYSSGEAGEPPPPAGNYRTDNNNPADVECRRWDLAYSQVLDDRIFGEDLTVETFACSGAITKNIYSVNVSDSETNGPSDAVAEKYVNDGVNAGWEPRQAVSLGMEDDYISIDMVTVTIGGNDMMFADVVEQCVKSTCNAGFLEGKYGQSFEAELDDLEDELVEVYGELKSVTGSGSALDREATVFVLGYPHLVPPADGGAGSCRSLTAEPVTLLGGISFTLDIFNYPNFVTALNINAAERRFLRWAADGLNAAIRRATARAGVHFVNVSDAFNGHDPCSIDPWVYGVEGEALAAVSGRTFHPTEAGHAAYADVLARYIAAATRGVTLDPLATKKFENAKLSEAGLPLNPDPAPASRQRRAGGAEDAGGSGESVQYEPEDEPTETEILLVRQQAPAPACRLYVPGERLTLTAGGFAADSAVTLTAVGATAAGTALPLAEIPAVVSDGEGHIETNWVVPAAPAATTDPAPRLYGVQASGPAASSGTLRAVMVQPVVAYPAAAPCASDDAATTALGQAVTVAVLANDTAPYGGSLDPASVYIEAAYNGTITINSADGSLMYAPDPGFIGSETIKYWVYDNWDIGVSAELTVTVNADCTITGAAGAVDIQGTDGNDVICVPDPDDGSEFHVIDAKAGNDIILGSDGMDWIKAGAGDDVIYGRGGDDRIRGGPGTDTIYSGRGFDTITSADLDDIVIDEHGDDWFHGYEFIVESGPVPGPAAPVVSSDKTHANPGETIRIAVLGNDYDPDGDLDASTLKITRVPTAGTAQVADTSGLGPHVRYVAADADGSDAFGYEVCDIWDRCAAAQVNVTVGASGCDIYGTDADDIIFGTDGDDIICGLAGDDVIDGRGGNDTIFGGPGDDTISGSWGHDTIWAGPGNDTLNGNAGEDTLHGGPGHDTANGGGGADTVWAGPGDDTLNGNAGDDNLWGGNGGDIIDGGNGNDTIWGEAGSDQLTGGTGTDTLHGGEGDDILSGNSQNDGLHGGPGADTLHGGGHNDTLYGDTGNDRIYGNAGNDLGFGGWGNDYLNGGNGNDYLNGGDNTDTCTRGETTARCET